MRKSLLIKKISGMGALSLMCLVGPRQGYSEEEKDRGNLSGVSLGYLAPAGAAFQVRGPRWGGEVDVQLTSVQTYGARVTRFAGETKRWKPFMALQGDWIRYKIDDVSHDGQAISGLLGMEYFFQRRWSLRLDAGVLYIWLEQESSTVNNGMDFVGNVALFFHMGDFQKKEK